jgi:hypothetical protein
MKEISEYTLKECLEEIEMLHGGYGYRDPEKLADRIHDLTRWIPVSERMPTKEDADEQGYVLAIERENESPYKKYPKCRQWDRFDDKDYFYTITHWKRITPPEGV